MDNSAVKQLRERFLKFLPDFKSFSQAPEKLREWETDYKRKKAEKVHGVLQPYVNGEKQFSTDDEARAILMELISETNFLNWRDKAYVEEQLLSKEGDWIRFAGLMMACLTEMPEGSWEPPLAKLLNWLNEKGCAANISKILPTYFLFFWDPKHHFCIKSDFADRLLKRMGEEHLGRGQPLTVERYRHVLESMQRLGEALRDWQPRDNIDLHSFGWVVTGGWGDVPNRGTGPDPRPKPPPSRLDLPLNLILAGPPGTGKTYRILHDFIPLFQDRAAQATPTGRYEFVTFHQSYSYEDFVEGIKPELTAAKTDDATGEVRYTVEPGIFLRIVRRAISDPHHCYALFIDEINRANIANVLGELITLLEPDKRMHFDEEQGEWVGGVRVKLPYTHASRPTEPPVGVPDNLYVIGTMNTADRSIALLDLALRRRFTFDEMMPDHKLLAMTPGPIATDDGSKIHLDRLLEAMNQRIEYLYDRDHTIGHSYLMDVQSLEHLERAFQQRILPLLQEYFYGDWHKIQLVLGDLIEGEDTDFQPKAHSQAIVTHVVQRPKRMFGLEDESYQTRRSYTISDDISAASFRKIYEAVESS